MVVISWRQKLVLARINKLNLKNDNITKVHLLQSVSERNLYGELYLEQKNIFIMKVISFVAIYQSQV